jgi:hypothetical protein
MIAFEQSDNGNVPDRWPHTDLDILPSLKITMLVNTIPVGYIVVTPSRNRITNMFIDKEHRGNGFADQLFDYTVNNFTITNFCAAVYDGLDDVGRLISWHNKKGFVPIGAVEMVRKS